MDGSLKTNLNVLPHSEKGPLIKFEHRVIDHHPTDGHNDSNHFDAILE